MTGQPEPPSGPRRLRLAARDAEDLAVIGTVLQDAIVPVAEMAYLAEQRRFVLVAHRFRWETMQANAEALPERVLAALDITGVKAVKTRNIDLKDRAAFLGLLTVAGDASAIRITFAEDRDILVEVERLECALTDFGEPWPTPNVPAHGVEG